MSGGRVEERFSPGALCLREEAECRKAGGRRSALLEVRGGVYSLKLIADSI